MRVAFASQSLMLHIAGAARVTNSMFKERVGIGMSNQG